VNIRFGHDSGRKTNARCTNAPGVRVVASDWRQPMLFDISGIIRSASSFQLFQAWMPNAG